MAETRRLMELYLDQLIQTRPDQSLSKSALTAIASGFATLCEWQARHQLRQRIAWMDDRLLDDIGMTRAQADAEAAKPFWVD